MQNQNPCEGKSISVFILLSFFFLYFPILLFFLSFLRFLLFFPSRVVVASALISVISLSSSSAWSSSSSSLLMMLQVLRQSYSYYYCYCYVLSSIFPLSRVILQSCSRTYQGNKTPAIRRFCPAMFSSVPVMPRDLKLMQKLQPLGDPNHLPPDEGKQRQDARQGGGASGGVPVASSSPALLNSGADDLLIFFSLFVVICSVYLFSYLSFYVLFNYLS